MAAIGEAIKRLREERGWTQAELGRRVGLDGSSIARRELGRIGVQAHERRTFAAAFGMSLVDFDEHRWRRDEPRPRIDSVVPLLNRKADGQIIDYEGEAVESGQGDERLDFNSVAGAVVFSVIVVGHSMRPTLADGDELILSPLHPARTGKQLSDGKIVFARFTPEHGGGCTLARFYREQAGGIRLHKDNPMYAPIQCDPADLQTVAIAVERRVRL